MRWIASVGGVGLLPQRLWGSDAGAGTVGAAVAAVGAWALWDTPIWLQIVVAGSVTLLSLATTRRYEGTDPGWVCVDEAAGVFVASIGLTSWPWLIAWVAFRAFDITKSLPGIRQAEGLPGGITADDVVAGIYALAVGWAVSPLL
ncbi:MAG: phosphatidylglycerophosphatase A [Acidimicrobiia bacterium]|nr:phosphatidylglycerophosphatase A [Acidimicrobiia bacterium]